MSLLAIMDSETSGKRFWQDNLLQLSFNFMDTSSIEIDVFGSVKMGDLNEKELSFDFIAPLNDDFQADAIRANRIGLNDDHKSYDKMKLKYTDVDYAWNWIKKNHVQSPRDVFNTIRREVDSYSTGGKLFNPVMNDDENGDVTANPVFLVAANPAFDYPFIERYFEINNMRNPFYYAPIDIKCYYAEKFKVPFKETQMYKMARGSGVTLSQETGAHTARADASALKKVVLNLLRYGVKF